MWMIMHKMKTVFLEAIAILFLLVIGGPASYGQARPRKEQRVEKTHIEYSLDTVMQRIDDMHQTLNDINAFREKGLDTAELRSQLPGINNTLTLVRSTVSGGMMLEYKRLLLDEYVLADIRRRLEAWRSQLFLYNNNLVKMNAETEGFGKDSVLRGLIHDSLYREMYQEELDILARKWQEARQTTGASLSGINSLQSAITQPYFETIDLQDRVETLKDGIAGRLFEKEYPYLWEGDAAGTMETTTGRLAAGSLQAERGLLDYFLQRNSGTYIYALIVGVFFFTWVTWNFRSIHRREGGSEALRQLNLRHLRPWPLLTSLVVMLNILPFFNLNAPPLLTQSGQFLLLIVVSILFARRWPKRYLVLWGLVVLLYLLFVGMGAALVPKQGARLWFLLLNAGSMVLGYYCIRKLLPFLPFPVMVKVVCWIFLGLNGLAIIANVLGRLSVSRVCSTSAIFSLVQIILLSVFIDCVMEAFRLQILASRLQKKSAGRVALLERMSKGMFLSLAALSVITWLAAFSINLDIYDAVAEMARRVVDQQLRLGSVTFRIGNVLLFIFVLYISNLLQKYIGYLYGQADGKVVAQPGIRGSRLVMIRLVLVIAGFLIAIAASGLPVDRITIVLGALGVGIGLGLQNIVNNLVSGVILIFERPFQIGDYIELNGKKGIVRDMGIRASKLVTEEGTEIIMPNGDLLSGEVINWTARNNQVRIEVPLTVESGRTFEELSAIVIGALKDHPGLSRTDEPRVLFNNSTDKTISFTVLIWVENIGQIQTIKSELSRVLVQQLLANQIRTV
jgi:potassium-dependent mechanosensitive channel